MVFVVQDEFSNWKHEERQRGREEEKSWTHKASDNYQVKRGTQKVRVRDFLICYSCPNFNYQTLLSDCDCDCHWINLKSPSYSPSLIFLPHFWYLTFSFRSGAHHNSQNDDGKYDEGLELAQRIMKKKFEILVPEIGQVTEAHLNALD